MYWINSTSRTKIMKIVELINHIAITLNNEEADVLARFESATAMYKKDLTEREVTIANQLVNKDVLLRRKNNGKTQYTKKIHST
jgi:hypothetical protein